MALSTCYTQGDGIVVALSRTLEMAMSVWNWMVGSGERTPESLVSGVYALAVKVLGVSVQGGSDARAHPPLASIAYGAALVTLLGCGSAEAPTDPSLAAVSRLSPVIVTLKHSNDTDREARELAKSGTLRFVYSHVLKGFAADLPEQAIEALKRNPNILRVEADDSVHATDVQNVDGLWGLDRIDSRPLAWDDRYSYTSTGAGVHVYIFDSGIRSTHREFGGRVAPGFTPFADGFGTEDCNGHGTHVAGIVGAKTYGVAKGVTLHSVRVLNCACATSYSAILAGIDWLTANAQFPAVVNASWAGLPNVTVEGAIAASIARGVVWVAAAGNSSQEAAIYVPAVIDGAITVAATGKADQFETYSNFGEVVDLAAPGTDIYSTWYLSDSSFARHGGTSMAAPAVAGAVAMILQRHPAMTPAEAQDSIVGQATPNILTGVPAGTPNRMLYTGPGSGGTPPPPPPPPPSTVDAPPVASFTVSCPGNGRTCRFTSTSTDDKGIVSYDWTFGDGSSGSGGNVSHTYSAKGSYGVTLKVTDTSGQSANRSGTAVVKK